MAVDVGQFDNFYYTICNESGGIEGLLNSLFSFLIRRTDFFFESSPGDKMGFPPGVNQNILFQTFQKYRQQHYQKFPKKSPEQYQEQLKQYQAEQQKQNNPQQPAASAANTPQPIASNPLPPQQNIAQLEPESEQQPQSDSSIVKQPNSESKSNQQNKASISAPVVQAQESNESTQPKVSLDIPTYNGAQTQKYLWSQNINDVTVQVNVPSGTIQQDLIIDLKKNFLKAQLKNEPTSRIQGELYDVIDADNSSWSIEDGNKIVFVLEKSRENIWKSVIKGDQQIDATQVDNSQPLQDFDPQTQGALRKIMYEQQRKQMGLPTTEEEKQLEMLKQAWDADGSPFKGQPFDPSKFNLPPPQMNFG